MSTITTHTDEVTRGEEELTRPGKEIVHNLPPALPAPTYIPVTGEKYNQHFLVGGLIFLTASMALFAMAAYTSFIAMQNAPQFTIAAFENAKVPGAPPEEHLVKLVAGLIGFLLAPAICVISAAICSMLGIRLLRSSGAVAAHVIAPQDYALLGPAIAAGNSDAIGQFIRLSSLSGATGTFTKVGLTGLPLATIVLTLILAVLGLFNDQFFDLAKLTLGAFLGSFVQRQAEATAPKA
ncbi:MAG TPA: hypothetical protein VGO04_01645 [Ensifer sp.]|jgi:hypothetical protein|uniref:hypothetical protein n=1 Tax=Ensifer sp. TaxID=1872086 RepID=UPI002E0E9FCF|nr:hypothetical protein [Ensifer sp.]